MLRNDFEILTEFYHDLFFASTTSWTSNNTSKNVATHKNQFVKYVDWRNIYGTSNGINYEKEIVCVFFKKAVVSDN